MFGERSKGIKRRVVVYGRRSPSLTYAAKSAMASAQAWRRLWWRAQRPSAVREYLRGGRARKLQLGCGDLPLSGWLNTDLDPRIARAAGSEIDVVYLDIGKPFPLADATFDYVYAEHVIEHVAFDVGGRMLAESRRVLRSGGTLRLATPDLEELVRLYTDRAEPTREQAAYAAWIAESFLGDPLRSRPSFVLNNAFRAWGHMFLYDEETLRTALRDAGFEDVRRVAFGVSDDPELQGLERHGSTVGSVEMNVFETMVLEASRP